MWLLGENTNNITTTDLMGTPFKEVMKRLDAGVGDCGEHGQAMGLVAPASSTELDQWTKGRRKVEPRARREENYVFEEVWRYRRHLNLDDLDVGEEGVMKTLARVVGRRGLVVWGVRRGCADGGNI